MVWKHLQWLWRRLIAFGLYGRIAARKPLPTLSVSWFVIGTSMNLSQEFFTNDTSIKSLISRNKDGSSPHRASSSKMMIWDRFLAYGTRVIKRLFMRLDATIHLTLLQDHLHLPMIDITARQCLASQSCRHTKVYQSGRWPTAFIALAESRSQSNWESLRVLESKAWNTLYRNNARTGGCVSTRMGCKSLWSHDEQHYFDAEKNGCGCDCSRWFNQTLMISFRNSSLSRVITFPSISVNTIHGLFMAKSCWLICR